jgi:hypothetical protein
MSRACAATTATRWDTSQETARSRPRLDATSGAACLNRARCLITTARAHVFTTNVLAVPVFTINDKEFQDI